MEPDPPREPAERKRDVLARLTGDIDLWLATAGAGGPAHLVPLSFAWHDGRIVMATAAASPTVANLRVEPRARAALGHTRDVVLIDGTARVAAADDVAAGAAAFAERTGWDPSPLADYVFIVLVPDRVAAWREENELTGRTLMRAGTWVV